MANKRMNFTIVQHGPRLIFDLTLNEYCVADTIYHLSNNPKNLKQGWCYQSKVNFGKQLGLSKQTIHTIINKLVDKKLVVRNDESQLRTTEKWYSEVYQREVNGQQSGTDEKKPYSKSSKNHPYKGQESLHNNDNNKDIEKSFSVEKHLPTSIKNLKREVLSVLQYFADIYKEIYSKRPVYGVKEVYCVKNALKHLSVSEANQLVNDWFDNPRTSEEYRPIITMAFSNSNLSRWKALY